MKYCQKNKFLSIMIVILFLFNFSIKVKAKQLSLKESIKWGMKHSSDLRDLKYRVNDLEREVAKLETQLAWQLNFTTQSNYQRQTIIQTNDPETNIEKQKELVISFQGSKSFLWGLNLTPNLSLNRSQLENKAFQWNNIEDRIEANFEVTQKLYPWVPSKIERDLYSVQNNLLKVKNNLKWARETKKIEWIEKYFNLLCKKQNLEVANKDYKLAQDNLKQVKEQKEIDEAGEQQILQAKIKLKDSKSNLIMIKNEYNQNKKSLLQKLGLPKNRKIILKSNNYYLKKFKKRIAEFKINKLSKLNKKVNNNHPSTINNKLDQKIIVQKLKWEQKKDNPKINLTGNYDYQSKDWSLRLNINYNLLDREQQNLFQKDYKKKLEKLKKEYNDLTEKLNIKLKRLFNQLTQAKLNKEQKKLILAKTRLEKQLFTKQFQNGSITKKQLIKKLIKLEKNKIDYKFSKYKLLIAKLDLYHFVYYDFSK